MASRFRSPRESCWSKRLIALFPVAICLRSAITPPWVPSKPAIPAWWRSTERWSEPVRPGATPRMNVVTESPRVDMAQREAFDRILQNHDLYCTVCDNNNGNCTVHNTVAHLDVNTRCGPSAASRTSRITPIPSTATIPTSASSAAVASRPARTCRSTRPSPSTGSREHPRVLWDGGEQIAGSSCVSCGHCVTVCPCNALMEKTHARPCRLLHRPSPKGPRPA